MNSLGWLVTKRMRSIPGISAHVFDQHGEIGDCAVFHFAAIGVDVLAQQRDFFYALLGQSGYLDEDILETARYFGAPGIGNDAVAAILAASFHDRYVGNRRFHAGRGEDSRISRFREN